LVEYLHDKGLVNFEGKISKWVIEIK
jgi:hypothetical protein